MAAAAASTSTTTKPAAQTQRGSSKTPHIQLHHNSIPMPPPPFSGRRAHLHRPAAVPAEQLAYWDVVEYQPNNQAVSKLSAAAAAAGAAAGGGRLRLGLVQQVECGHVQVSPLIEEDEGVWVPEAEDAESPEQQQAVPLDRVLRIVESAYGQRQDKEHNPHGEHAHDVWQVLVPLSEGVFKGPGSNSDSDSDSSSS